jgi:citrate synthase
MPVEPWTTAVSDADATSIRIRGYDLTALMVNATFSDVLFLLHQGRLPSEGERRLIEAILIAVVDHGPGSPSAAAARMVASGNRQAPEAAVAAGILAMGDVHGGAGMACVELITTGVTSASDKGTSIESAANETVTIAIGRGARLPGLGHRLHAVDPRTAVLFDLAKKYRIAGKGVHFMTALAQAAGERIKPMPLNIDGALAAVLYDMECTPLFARFIFVIGRAGGLTAQIMEEYTRERPMRVKVPVSYDGEPPRDMPSSR